MRSLAITFLFLAACGGGSKDKPAIDASGDGPTADAGIDAPPAALPTCADYCTKVMAACTAGLQQYANATDCMNSCQHFMLGATGMTSANTVGCRVYHAEAAVADPTTHCAHAGPGGGGTCGSVCNGFCSIAVPVCPTQQPNLGTCMTNCAGYTALGTPYNQSIQSGNTQECRLYHATAASTSPGVHCPHVATVSSTCQ
jgi:hypothetical protein